MNESDTIAAICTAFGNSGIHIIRISGDKSFNVINRVFKKGKSLREFNVNSYKSHTIHYGFICDNDKVVDEVMVSIYKAPNSYTKENVIEVNCHGGSYVVKKILKLLLNNGVRMAEPGEFSKRAFLNGRMDLSQAEAVMDIIKSQNEYSLSSSVNQLRGDIRVTIQNVRDSILREVAYIEAALDDPEHYDLDNYSDNILSMVNDNLKLLRKLVSSYSDGKIIKEGINTVIAGKPNVGKSSLMNYLMRENKAIVTDIPGTTRDIIEHSINLGDITLNLMDTAGIRSTDDYIEKLGIERSLESIEKAQLVLCVLDYSRPLEDDDKLVLKKAIQKKNIIILNKCDLECKIDMNYLDSHCLNGYIKFSTKKDYGYSKFIKMLNEMFYSNVIDIENELFITNIRHVESLNKAVNSLEQVISDIKNCMPEDFMTINMMEAYTYLGEIIGETIDDDLVDKIFSEFCMGK